MALSVGVSGATGRMGRMVLAEIAADPELQLAWQAGRALPDDLGCDVVIDFSAPDGLRALIARSPAPVVSGTTGTTLSGPFPVAVLHSPNFALGVAVLRRLAHQAARLLPGYDVEVVELHHRAKGDAPSGTALALAAGLGRIVRGHGGLREPGTVGVHSVRGGDIVGEHTVYLAGPGERLQLGHVATHRGVFAAGAIHAARWIVGRPPGLYTIDDLFGGPLGAPPAAT